MNSKQLLAKLKAYPLAVGLFLAAAVLGGWTYWRSTGALADMQAQLDEVTQQNELISKNSAAGELLNEQLAELTSDADKFSASLINPVEDIPNQQYFYDLEHTAGVEQIADPIHTLTTRGKDPSEPAVATYTLAVAGHWDNLVSFLYSLQTGPHPLRITLFQLTKSQQIRGTDAERLELNLAVEMLGK
ncbi:MAG TPA: hypothetical protein VHC95_08730 [Opitutales bacterium]|nr:hypothetical protein [Opitutales bacterium]